MFYRSDNGQAQKQLITIVAIVQIENRVRTPEMQWTGRTLIEGLNTIPIQRSIYGFNGNGFKTVKKVRKENGELIVERVRDITPLSEETSS